MIDVHSITAVQRRVTFAVESYEGCSSSDYYISSESPIRFSRHLSLADADQRNLPTGSGSCLVVTIVKHFGALMNLLAKSTSCYWMIEVSYV